MGSLEDAYRERQRQRAAEKARWQGGSPTPTNTALSLCQEFARLAQKQPLPIAVEESSFPPKRSHAPLFGRTRPPYYGLHVYRPVGIHGWHLGVFVVTTTGEMISGGLNMSVAFKNHPVPQGHTTGRYLQHLKGAGDGDQFIAVPQWPYDWTTVHEPGRVTFYDEHPDYKGAGPSITFFDPNAGPTGPAEMVNHYSTFHLKGILLANLD